MKQLKGQLVVQCKRSRNECDKCPCGLEKWCKGCTYPNCDEMIVEGEDEIERA